MMAPLQGWQPLEHLGRKRPALNPVEMRAVRRLTRSVRRMKSRRLAAHLATRTSVLPVRFAIHLVHSQRRMLFYRELALFSVFVVTLICLLLFLSPEVHECWETTEVLTEAFELQLDGLDANSPFNECKVCEPHATGTACCFAAVRACVCGSHQVWELHARAYAQDPTCLSPCLLPPVTSTILGLAARRFC